MKWMGSLPKDALRRDGLAGVASWQDAAAREGAVCRQRIYVATLDTRLVALDRQNGEPCADFGEDSVLAPVHVDGVGFLVCIENRSFHDALL